MAVLIMDCYDHGHGYVCGLVMNTVIVMYISLVMIIIMVMMMVMIVAMVRVATW